MAPVAERAVGLRRRLGFGLAVLTSINLANYADRYIVPAVLEPLERGLHLDDAQVGWLPSVFLIVYLATAPIFGRLGDTRSRRRALAIGVAIWSLATGAAGLASGLASLLVARAIVGVGEAAYGSIAPSLLSDYYPPTRRNFALTIFNVAVPVGSAIGFGLGGALAASFGWRAAFALVGIPGLLLALLVLAIPEPPRGRLDPAGECEATAPPLGDTLRRLAKNREYVLTVAGFAAYTFAIGGLATWMPTFLVRERNIPLARANLTLGAIAVGTGLAGTLLGGWLGDLLAPRIRGAYLWLSALSLIAAFPVALLALRARAPGHLWTALAAAELLVFFSTGPINAVLVNCVPAGMRAIAMAVCIFFIHLFGDALSSPLIGYVSRASGLSRAVLLVPMSMIVGSVFWFVAASRALAPAAAVGP